MEDNKTKVSTLRVNLNDEEAFKQYLKDNGYTQAEGFKNLVALMELDNAKKQLNDRAKEIDTFRDTVNKLIHFYVNSLEVNQVAEERIREELNKELVTKDKTISSLQEQLNKQIETIDKLKITDEEISKVNRNLVSDKEKALKEIETLTSNNKTLQEQIMTLNAIITEYKSLKDLNISLETDNKELKETNQNLNIELKQLNDKIINANDMLVFYKEQVAELNEQVKMLMNKCVNNE